MTNTLAPIGSLATVHRRFRTVTGEMSVVTSGSAYESAVLADSPMAYWRLNEVAGGMTNEVGTLGDLTVVGGGTRGVTGAVGDGDFAFQADGVDDGLTRTAGGGELTLSGDWTLDFWLKILSNPAVNSGVIQFDTGGAGPLDLYYNGPTGIIYVRQVGGNDATATTAINDATFHHIAYVQDGSTGRLYIDGTEEDTDAMTIHPSSNTITAMKSVYGGENTNGVIDEIAIYPSALSPARIAAHATATGGGGPVDKGMSGSLIKLPNKMVGGTVSPTHIMSRKVFANSLAGLLSPTGNASKLLYEAVGGVLSPTGNTSKLMYQALSAVLSPIGTTTKILGRLVGGTLAPIGSMTRLISKTITALLVPTGEKSVTTFRTILAVLSPTGGANRLYDLLITAVLDPIGTVTNLRVKLVGGTLSPTHTMIRFMERKTGIGGTLSPIGSTSKMPNRILSAVLTPIGTIRRLIPRTIFATLSPVGTIQRLFSRTLTATLSPIGTIQRMFKRTITGTLSIISSTLVNVLSFPITFFTNQMYAVTEFGEVQEASSTVLHIDWKDRNNVAMTPTFISYRIIDYYSGTTIVSDTSVTPTGSSTNIAVGPGQNAIVNNERQFEIRKVILTFGITGSQRNTEVKEYTLRNLGGVP